MPTIHQPHIRIHSVPPKRLSTRLNKYIILRAPHRQHRHFALSQIRVEPGIQAQVRAIVEEQRELDLLLAMAREERRVERVRRRVDAGQQSVGDVVRVLPLCWRELEEGHERLCFGRGGGEGGGGGPEGAEGRPERLAEAFFVCVSVLGDDGGDAVGVAQGEADASRGLHRAM